MSEQPNSPGEGDGGERKFMPGAEKAGGKAKMPASERSPDAAPILQRPQAGVSGKRTLKAEPAPQPKPAKAYDPIANVRAAARARDPMASAAPPSSGPKGADPFAGMSSGTIDDPEAQTAARPEGRTGSRSDWERVEDHRMSRKSRMAWAVGIYGTLIALPVALFVLSPFPPKDTVGHHVSALGCQFAAMFEMTGAAIGEAGYHASLDLDGNGVACDGDASARIDAGETRSIRR